MNRWKNRAAVVTGASAGIGWATAKALLQSGMVVVGVARNVEKINQLKATLPTNLAEKLHAYKCDVTNELDIQTVFKRVDHELGGADILVNNAGVLRNTLLTEPDNTRLIRETLETNVMGMVLCAREAYQSMKRRQVDGHIVNINSVVGHSIPMEVTQLSNFNVYPATKHAVTAISEMLRIELLSDKSKVKVTSISPGAVRTNLIDDPRMATTTIPLLEPDDVAQSLVFVISTPKHVEIKELIIKAHGECF